MTRRAAVRPGQSVLILGAAGGIGTAAIQIAKALGATVIAVARREGVAQRLTALGADHVVRLVPGWALRVRDLTDGVGVDHVLDPVGERHSMTRFAYWPARGLCWSSASFGRRDSRDQGQSATAAQYLGHRRGVGGVPAFSPCGFRGDHGRPE